MMEFVVKVKGEEKTRWVLAVDGERLLLTREDRTLRCVQMAECEFVGAVPPDQPRPVMVMQPQEQGPQLAVVGNLTEMRRGR